MRDSWSLEKLDELLGGENVSVWKEAYTRPLQRDGFSPYKVSFREFAQQVRGTWSASTLYLLRQSSDSVSPR
jgi:hypothetical protein